ncbi:hypothetical protein P3S67_030658 [Capsicum chacoense]
MVLEIVIPPQILHFLWGEKGVTDLARGLEKLWLCSHSVLLSYVFLVGFCRQEKCLSPSSMIFRPKRTCLGVECFGAFHVVKGFCFSDLAKKLVGFSWD